MHEFANRAGVAAPLLVSISHAAAARVITAELWRPARLAEARLVEGPEHVAARRVWGTTMLRSASRVCCETLPTPWRPGSSNCPGAELPAGTGPRRRFRRNSISPVRSAATTALSFEWTSTSAMMFFRRLRDMWTLIDSCAATSAAQLQLTRCQGRSPIHPCRPGRLLRSPQQTQGRRMVKQDLAGLDLLERCD